MNTLHVSSPAKINLFLAITGRREDGYHNLLSVAAPLAWGDTLHADLAEKISLSCDDPNLPVDANNLVLKAAAAFKSATGWKGGANLQLEKRIPLGAGLGGGSSNAVATLKVLNELAGGPLGLSEMRAVAATLGSDCALFVEGSAVIMRGRGERLEKLGEPELARLRHQRVLIFKPGFGVSTPWAYGKMAAHPHYYLDSVEAEARLESWRSDGTMQVESLLFNNMETVIYAKYPALPALHDTLRQRFGLVARMSGSGSASFVLLDGNTPTEAVESCIREAWGHGSTIITTSLV